MEETNLSAFARAKCLRARIKPRWLFTYASVCVHRAQLVHLPEQSAARVLLIVIHLAPRAAIIIIKVPCTQS